MSPTPAPRPDLPGLPLGDGDEPVFRAPWQAQAFAMTLQLHARGLFTWPQWAAALAARLAADEPATPAADPAEAIDRYYTHWLAALEDLTRQTLDVGGDLDRHVRAWDHAALRTPHGQPIELRDEDFEDRTR